MVWDTVEIASITNQTLLSVLASEPHFHYGAVFSIDNFGGRKLFLMSFIGDHPHHRNCVQGSFTAIGHVLFGTAAVPYLSVQLTDYNISLSNISHFTTHRPSKVALMIQFIQCYGSPIC